MLPYTNYYYQNTFGCITQLLQLEFTWIAPKKNLFSVRYIRNNVSISKINNNERMFYGNVIWPSQIALQGIQEKITNSQRSDKNNA